MQPTIRKTAADCQIVPYTHLSALEHLQATYEMVVPRTGIARLMLDGQDLTVHPGEILTIFPGLLHSFDASCVGTGLMLIFSEKMLPESEAACAGMQPANPVLPLYELDGDVTYCISRLEEMAAAGRTDETFARLYLTLLFARLLPSLKPEDPAGPVTHDLLYRAMQYMSQNLSAPLTVRLTAHALGVNNYYLSHVLNEKLHMSFRAYLNALRVERARRLLRVTAYPIEEIAAACGFENLRTFDRVFGEHCECTPREYRKNIALAKSDAGESKPNRTI